MANSEKCQGWGKCTHQLITQEVFTFGSQIPELHSLLLSLKSSSRVPLLVWCSHMLPWGAVKESCSPDVWMYTVLLPCAGPRPAAETRFCSSASNRYSEPSLQLSVRQSDITALTRAGTLWTRAHLYLRAQMDKVSGHGWGRLIVRLDVRGLFQP